MLSEIKFSFSLVNELAEYIDCIGRPSPQIYFLKVEGAKAGPYLSLMVNVSQTTLSLFT